MRLEVLNIEFSDKKSYHLLMSKERSSRQSIREFITACPRQLWCIMLDVSQLEGYSKESMVEGCDRCDGCDGCDGGVEVV